MVLESENAKMVWKSALVDRVGKTRHEGLSDICLNDPPPLRSLLNDANRMVCGIEKLSTESRNPPLVELCRADEFRLGIGMVNQAHPMARRAACRTSS